MRNFNTEIFCGNGSYSTLIFKELEKTLRRAVGNLSGIQQGSGVVPEEEIKKVESDLEDNVRDIVMALMNREVAFGPNQGYSARGKNMPRFSSVIVDQKRKTVTKGSCGGRVNMECILTVNYMTPMVNTTNQLILLSIL